MRHKSNFAFGRHLVAARTLAGLTQEELATLSGIHRNSLKRWEGMATIDGGWALEKIEAALRSKGVIAQRWPVPAIMLASVHRDD